MAGNAPGTGFMNVASGISGITATLFGNDGAGDDIAAVINAGKGNVNSGTYPTAPTVDAAGNNMLLYLGGSVILVLILVMILKK